jgi:hypothetical protein
MKSSNLAPLSPPRLYHRLRHLRFENKGLKLLALAIALLLFAISRQPVSDVRLVGVPLEFRGLGRGLEISGNVDQTVSVSLRGPRDIVRNLLPNQLAVAADLSDKEPGERIIQLKATDVARPGNIEILRIEPSTIRLQIEQTARRRVPVKPELMGTLPEGMEIYAVTLNPQEVEIEGPQSAVTKVESVETESIRLDGRTTNFRASIDVDSPAPSVRITTPGPVSLAVELGEQRTTRRFEHLPINWLDPSPGARLATTEASVELYGPRSALEALRPEQIGVALTTAGGAAAAPRVELPGELRGLVTVKSISPAEVKVRR